MNKILMVGALCLGLCGCYVADPGYAGPVVGPAYVDPGIVVAPCCYGGHGDWGRGGERGWRGHR